jgi:hypothetical protein
MADSQLRARPGKGKGGKALRSESEIDEIAPKPHKVQSAAIKTISKTSIRVHMRQKRMRRGKREELL